MGKKLLGKRFNSSSENGLARCSWGMLHLIKYNHWTHVKKRLTYRRHSSGVTKFPTSCTDDSIDDEVPKQDYVDMDQSIVEEEGAKPSTPKKNSMKARIRALISEDMHKKKGKHHRSASCPVSHLTKSDSFHNIESADLSPIAEIVLTNASPGTIHPINETSYDANELDSMSIDSSEEPMIGNKTKKCENMIVGVNSEHDQVIRNHATLRGKSAPKTPLIAKQRSSSAINSGSSLPHSKEYLDALDIININKELLLKILQDPGSPLAQHFRDQHVLSSKKGLTKSESFPGPGSSRRTFEPSKLKCNQENNRSETKDEGNSDYRGPAQMSLLYAGSSQQLGNQGEDQVGVRRFKDLKHKIKHFIKESRKERHRIALDSILHKVPCGQTFSEDLEKAVDDKMKDPEIDGQGKDNLKFNNTIDEVRSSNKNPVHYMRRASSLKESMDRYCHLFETTSSGDAKHHTPDRLKVRTEEAGSSFNGVLKYLGRMLSMPNLKSYFYSYEQCPDAFSSKALVTIVADGSSNIASNSDKQRNQNLSKESENLLQLDGFSGSLVQDNSDGVGELGSTTCGEVVSTSVSNNVTNFLLDSELNVDENIMQVESTLKPRHIDTQDNSIEQMSESKIDLPEVPSTLEMEKVENPNESLNFDISKFEIDAEVEAEFSYVRDILKLSGFSGNASLGSWHSHEQAVDPLLYEEVEGCFVHDPDCSGNEGGKCNHMLLFDLTNEVLIEIYRRSYNYCPIPLSSICNIHPMPIGYHVLKEVWVLISWYLSLRPEADQSPDKVVSCDLVNDGWMNLQFDSECVGLELGDMILDDLLDEVIWE